MSSFQPESLAAWEAWLEQHHEQAGSTWIVLGKKGSGLPELDFKEVVATALAFGWVDSLPNKIDDKRYKVRFSPRNPKSNWSAVNKAIIARLRAEGRLRPAGEALVAYAKTHGQWDALNDVDELVIHADLAAAFAKTPHARSHWEAFPPSVKRGILEWIYTAKRPATRAKRIAETASLAEQNKRANQWR